MAEEPSSRTAVLVCQGRAVGDGRLALGRFSDSVALRLLRGEEREAVARARTGVPPTGWRDRMEYEMLTATAQVVVTRSVVIDDAVRAAANPQLVILGAGLDGRAWRMPKLADVDVFEVDRPASQRDKRDRVEGLEPVARSVRYVPVEFGRDALAPALATAGYQDAVPTTWVWEGVLPYLSQPEVDGTIDVVAARSKSHSRLIATYPTPNLLAAVGRRAMRVYSKLAGRQDPLEHERHISAWTPEQMHHLLSARGFRVTADHDLYAFAQQLGIPARRSRAYGLGQAVVADKPSDEPLLR